MGDGAVKTGSKKSADEMDKKKKKCPKWEGMCFFCCKYCRWELATMTQLPVLPQKNTKVISNAGTLFDAGSSFYRMSVPVKELQLAARVACYSIIWDM